MFRVSRVGRRLVLGFAAGCFALALCFIVGSGSASAHPGHVHGAYADAGPCGPNMQPVGDRGLCTHGPDPAPPGVTAAEVDAPVAFTAAATGPCDGDGQSGNRIQVLYARASDVPDHFSTYQNSFGVWAEQADQTYQASAQETGGYRYLRFVHDANCTISVLKVTVDPADDDSINSFINALTARGYARDDRKYMVFLDVTDLNFCGQGLTYTDDSFGQANWNNIYTSWAVIYSGCWADETTAAHELGHALGAVQDSAPHYSGHGHCTDEWDVMCYKDGPGVSLQYLCGDYNHDARLDCNHDDYFSTNPPSGNYLATHWNVANSQFLGKTNPTRITLDKSSSKYNGKIVVTLSGFSPGYYVNITWPDQTLLAQVTADADGNATTMFRTPLVPLGNYIVRASDSTGNGATTTLRVIPRIMLAPESEGPTGFRFRVYYYGFSPGERVQAQWYNVAGTSYDVLATVTIASNGRGTSLLYVPANATIGKHMIRGKVIGVSRSASTSFTVTGPSAAEEPTATPSPTPSPTATVTPEPTGTPEEPATPIVEETPTIEPSPVETSTPEPAPTEIPTETPTSDASPTPTAES
jgi:hypothetical protein